MSSQSKLEFKRVEVCWVDSASQEGWVRLRVAKSMMPLEVKTVGYVINEDDKRIVVAQTVDAVAIDPVNDEERSCRHYGNRQSVHNIHQDIESSGV